MCMIRVCKLHVLCLQSYKLYILEDVNVFIVFVRERIVFTILLICSGISRHDV